MPLSAHCAFSRNSTAGAGAENFSERRNHRYNFYNDGTDGTGSSLAPAPASRLKAQDRTPFNTVPGLEEHQTDRLLKPGSAFWGTSERNAESSSVIFPP